MSFIAAIPGSGRFDKKIPLRFPDEAERRAIFEIMARKYRLKIPDIPAACIQATEGWTGAEIELVTVKAVELLEDEGRSPEEALEYATTVASPGTADVEFMALPAVRGMQRQDPAAAKIPATSREARRTGSADPGENSRAKRQPGIIKKIVTTQPTIHG